MSSSIPKENRKDNIENGVQVFNVNGWSGFYQRIYKKFGLKEENDQKKPYINDYIWRGDKSEGPLKSTFDKSYKRMDLRRHENSFAYASRGKLKIFDLSVREIKEILKSKDWNINHFWALGRHYDLKTPLLDWTMSPFVAAYFAFSNENTLEDVNWDENEVMKIKKKYVEKIEESKVEENKYKDRVVWGLKYKEMHDKLPLIESINKHKRKKRVEDKKDTYRYRKEDKKELYHDHGRGNEKKREHFRKSEMDHIFEYFDPMSSEHERLIDQRGLFTITKDGEYEDIIDIVKKYWTKDKYKDPWLIKIMIKSTSEIREDFLRGLNVMNINQMTLFREVEGAARFCNIGLDLEGYSIFPGQGV